MTEKNPIRCSCRRDHLPGGRADFKQPSDFDTEQLRIGTKHEKEHTHDESIAREIAMDHLTEDPDYYNKLLHMTRSKNPNRYRIRFWTGPTLVDKLKVAAEEAGYTVEGGTEDIYVVSEGSSADAAAHNFLVDLRKTHGTDFGLRMRSSKLVENPRKKPHPGSRKANPPTREANPKLRPRQEKILKEYVSRGGVAYFYDDLPADVRAALHAVGDQETLHMDVDRWLSDYQFKKRYTNPGTRKTNPSATDNELLKRLKF
jgi:hypothetical protein